MATRPGIKPPSHLPSPTLKNPDTSHRVQGPLQAQRFKVQRQTWQRSKHLSSLISQGRIPRTQAQLGERAESTYAPKLTSQGRIPPGRRHDLRESRGAPTLQSSEAPKGIPHLLRQTSPPDLPKDSSSKCCSRLLPFRKPAGEGPRPRAKPRSASRKTAISLAPNTDPV